MSRGAHRDGTPVSQLLAFLRGERGQDVPGVPLSGPISDRIRPLARKGKVKINPERGTEKAPKIPKGSYTGIPLTGRTRRTGKD